MIIAKFKIYYLLVMVFDIDYLNQLVADEIEENSELEYKSAAALQRDDKKMTDVTKDVSAFANSNGSVLI